MTQAQLVNLLSPRRPRLADLHELVEQRQPFRHTDVFAVGDDDNYVVYSFGTHHPIYVWLGGVWYANSAPSCASTTKHLALCRPDGHVSFLSMGPMRGLAAAALRNLGR